MGEHKGWRVRPDGARFRAEVWNPEVQRYRSRSFTIKGEAKDWAQLEAAGVVTGNPSALVTNGRALVSVLRKDFLKSMEARGRSDSHLANIKRTLDGLEKAAPDLSDRGAGLAIERWLDGLTVSAATRNRKLVEVRAFCNWLLRRDLIDKDPTRALERGDVADYLRPQFTVAELRTLLAEPDPYRARFALMLYAGLRGDEAAYLTWGSIDADSGVLLVRLNTGGKVKGNKERIVPIQAELLPLLGKRGADTALVAPVSGSNPSRLFWAFLNRHRVPVSGRSRHSCRHTYAGLMTATGIPSDLLGAYLGHGSAGTTMLYTKLAARFVSQVDGWPRGKLLITGSVPATAAPPPSSDPAPAASAQEPAPAHPSPPASAPQ